MLDNKTRLNSSIRDAVVNNALKSSGYFDEQKKLIEDRAAFASKVHGLVLEKTGVTQERLDAEWLRLQETETPYISTSASQNSYINVNLNGITVQLPFNGGEQTHNCTFIAPAWGEGSIQRWVPMQRQNLTDESLKQEYLALEARKNANKEKHDKLEPTVRAVLRSVGTVGKLLESWPEAAELLPDEVVKTSGTGLAIIPADLNALCGVPSPK